MAIRLYLVEDNPIILENLQETLQDIPGASLVGHSPSETEAVDWLTQHHEAWDWVIVDLFLKAGTGLGVLAKVARAQPLKNLLVLSNYAGKDIRHQCLRLGARAVFDKTQDIESFVGFIREQAAGGSAHIQPSS